jgi:hypothetical protein
LQLKGDRGFITESPLYRPKSKGGEKVSIVIQAQLLRQCRTLIEQRTENLPTNRLSKERQRPTNWGCLSGRFGLALREAQGGGMSKRAHTTGRNGLLQCWLVEMHE